MEQSMLIELIKTLSSEEKEQILQFVTLSFVHRSRSKSYVKVLLDLCLKHPWHEADRHLDKKEIQNTIFPGQVFVEGKLEKVMVDAHKLIRTFLITQYYLRDENEFHQILDFAEIIRLRGLDSRHRQQLSRLRKIQEDAPWQSMFYYHNQFLLEYAEHNEESLHNKKKGDLNIPATLDALEMHNYLNQLALLNVYLLQQKAASIAIPEAMKYRLERTTIPTAYLQKSPVIKINYAIFVLLQKKKNEPKDARALFDLLKLHENNLDVEALRSFYTYLRNICVLILSEDSNQNEIDKLLFELYEDNLERGFLHYEGKLHPSRYLAISEFAIRVEKLAWALEFIEKYKHEIFGENESQDLYRLNLAHYLFSTGQYSACLDNIPATSPYVDYLFAGKRLELKALYELNSDLLSYKMDAFKMFLSRTSNKLLPGHPRQINIDFLNLIFQLVASNPGDSIRAKRLIERVKSRNLGSEKQWLLTQATRLMGKNK